ncbi:ROK family transcriptional regulator [Microbacterium sp. NPDC080005]|uniref:ROK family transcriptional regulator n=1 Tax=Microbacterium sp. NPDC080005 TaxID=3155288 RepID=UPI00344B4E2A|nr:ROK family transcriptional regulator [Microbacterium oleivorans]
MAKSSSSTRGRVLDLIRAQGPVSRIELAELTALTPAAMTGIVRDLLAADLVTEVGAGAPTGGKRRMLLQPNPTAQFAVGIELGFVRVHCVLVDLLGRPISSVELPGAGEADPESVVERVAAAFADLVADAGVDAARLVGIGLVAPGPIDLSHGRAVQLPTHQQWQEYPLRDRLAELTGLPVWLGNDANAAAVGEHWTGAAGSARAFATVHMGVGIGAGLMVGGELILGASSNAGEIGHMSVDADGPRCHCGARGCVELIAAPFTVERLYRIATGEAVDSAEIGARALAGEGDALVIMEAAADAVATALVSLANVLDLDLVVFTGPGFGPALELFRHRAAHHLDRAFLSRRSHEVDVRVSAHAADAAALGAASLVLKQTLTA